MFVPREKLLEKINSVYKLVIIASRRALELSEGAPRLVEMDSKKKPALVALQEIAQGKISFKIKESKKKE